MLWKTAKFSQTQLLSNKVKPMIAGKTVYSLCTRLFKIGLKLSYLKDVFNIQVE